MRGRERAAVRIWINGAGLQVGYEGCMMTFDLLLKLLSALGCGLLVGLERGWKEREAGPGSRTAGIRTYALVGFLGGLSGLLLPEVGEIVVGFAFLVFGLIFAAFRLHESVHDGDFSVTGTVAALITFALGLTAVAVDPAVAAAGAVVTASVLAARPNLHAWVRHLTWAELRSALVFLAMTAVLLPVLPDRPVDPWGALNPYQIWLMIVLIAAMSLAGYFAVKIAGDRYGILFASAAGGLVSSTALTLANARLSRRSPASLRFLVGGTLLANAVSVARAAVIATVLAPPLLPIIAPAILPAVAFLAAATAAAFARARNGKGAEATIDLENPVDFPAVLKFGALLAAVMVATDLLSRSFGSTGLYVLSAITGLTDVDAITLSTARLAAGGYPLRPAATAILIAAGANAVAKSAIAAAAGSRRFAIVVGAGLAAAAFAGLAGLALFSSG